jgi:hypothetical protein
VVLEGINGRNSEALTCGGEEGGGSIRRFAGAGGTEQGSWRRGALSDAVGGW